MKKGWLLLLLVIIILTNRNYFIHLIYQAGWIRKAKKSLLLEVGWLLFSFLFFFFFTFPWRFLVHILRNPFSLKLSMVSIRLTSTGVKSMPKVFALSVDTLQLGGKGSSGYLLQMRKVQKLPQISMNNCIQMTWINAVSFFLISRLCI